MISAATAPRSAAGTGLARSSAHPGRACCHARCPAGWRSVRLTGYRASNTSFARLAAVIAVGQPE